MSDVEWDADDFEPAVEVKRAATDKWEGEDEDEAVKDAWDAEDDGEDKNDSGDPSAPKAVEKKKKRSLKEIIAEKEAKKKEDLLARKKDLEEKASTPENDLAEKLRRQRIQEEADLELAKQAFGVEDSKGSIDKMYPVTKEDFDAFGEALKEKLIRHEKSGHYVPFLESLLRDLCLSLDSEDVKRLSSTLTAIQNEKVKQLKAVKGKKKSKKGPSLVVGKAGTIDDVADDSYDLYDDFI